MLNEVCPIGLIEVAKSKVVTSGLGSFCLEGDESSSICGLCLFDLGCNSIVTPLVMMVS